MTLAVAADDDATSNAPVPLLPQQPGGGSGRFLSAVLDNLSDALVACDADGTLTLFNPAAQRLHGLPAATVPPEDWPLHYDLYDEDGVTRLEPQDVPLLRALRGEVVRDVEMVVKPAGQSARTLLASGQQILDGHGDVQGAVVVMHDITARRAAEALRSAQTVLEQQRLAAEASLARLEQLNVAALAVARQHNVDGVLQAITEQAAAVIGADQAVASLTRGDDWSQAVTAAVMGEPYSAWSEYDAMPDGSGIYALVCETNRPLRLAQAQLEAHPRYRHFGQHAAEHPPMRGWLAAPLIRRDGSNLGLIQLSAKHGIDADGRPAEFDDQDEALLVQLAQLASLALEKAVAYDREHQVAVALQRSLLPQTLPTMDGLNAYVEYVPGRGEADLSVGGDFYDVFEVDDDCVALVLGDVVGHGLRSASLMGQIRSGLRGLAMQQADPAIVVSALDKLVATLGDEAMATLAYATLHLPTGRLRLVLAGHPPPMLRREGHVSQIAAEPGLPLGAFPGSGYTPIDVQLDPDVTLLFYSDGLVEHRHRPVFEGIAQLERSLGAGPHDLASLCGHLLNDLTAGSNDDDVALLAVTRTA
jgi:PAS domain S-box-containing protein